MSRRKRASMREGPLADLFRSTSDDAPAEGPDRSAAGPVAEAGHRRPRKLRAEEPSPDATRGRSV